MTQPPPMPEPDLLVATFRASFPRTQLSGAWRTFAANICATRDAQWQAIVQQARAEALEEAAKVCEARATELWREWDKEADPNDQGGATVADELADAIRALQGGSYER